MSLITNYIKKEDRALPVFLLVDASGSMEGQKIGAVNVALKEMFNCFRKIENPKGVIEVCVIAFGNEDIRVIKPLSRITESDNYEIDAYGSTPMGKCIEKVADMIEDFVRCQQERNGEYIACQLAVVIQFPYNLCDMT